MGANLSYPEADLSGKVALVTGGNTGIGYETAKALARLGAHTFIGCRSMERAEQAIERMQNELNPNSPKRNSKDGSSEDEQVTSEEVGNDDEEEIKNGGKIEYLPLDLGSFQSTKECVRLFKERDLPLHILVNNAAIAWMPFSMTLDGYETHLQVNYLGPMLLTLELLPVLLNTAQSSADCRISFVSSKANSSAEAFHLERVLVAREQDFSRYRAYCNTKLYCVMLGETLQRKLKEAAITVSSPEPGVVKTEIHRGFADKSVLTFLTENLVYPIYARTPAEGAATTINCVVNPDLNSQQHHYYSDCRQTRANREAYDQSKQELLWMKSFEILADQLSPEILEKYGPKEESGHQQTPGNIEVAPKEDATGEVAVTKQKDDMEETPDGEAGQDSVTEKPFSEEPIRAEEVEVHLPENEKLLDKDSATDGTASQQEITDTAKNTVQDSLPVEPIKDRAEEIEIHPPGSGQEHGEDGNTEHSSNGEAEMAQQDIQDTSENVIQNSSLEESDKDQAQQETNSPVDVEADAKD